MKISILLDDGDVIVHGLDCYAVVILPPVTARGGIPATANNGDDGSVLCQLTDCIARTHKETRVANKLQREELDLKKEKEEVKEINLRANFMLQ